MTYQNFLNTFLGASWGYPDNNSFKGECLSIVKIYIKECFGISPPPSGTNSAYGYWSNFPSPLGTVFEKVVNTDTLIPEAGWIAIWKPWDSNPYGHIAIVAEDSTTGTLKNYAQNWTSKVFQLESNRYTNVVGFLKPKIISSIPTMTEEEQRILNFVREKKMTEGQVREGWGFIADNVNKKIADLEALVYKKSEEIDNLSRKLADEKKLILGWQSKYNTANEEIKILKQQLLEASVDKLTAWEHIKLGIELLIKQNK